MHMVCSIRVDPHRLRLFLSVPYGAELSSSHLLETSFGSLLSGGGEVENVWGLTTRRGADKRFCVVAESRKEQLMRE
jgi:hypothetical protein